MDLHKLPKSKANPKSRRVGRGGKKGFSSGRGSKGQKARSGVHQGADFRGGDTPIWKLFPKRRGANKKTPIKHRFFQLRNADSAVFNLERIDKLFSAGDTVSVAVLRERRMIRPIQKKIKILGQGVLTKPINFSGLKLSAQTKEKILQAGGRVEE